jgi:hypothetical protein
MGVPPPAMHDYKLTRERREREKAEVLMRFRTFAEGSTWKKARISLGTWRITLNTLQMARRSR